MGSDARLCVSARSCATVGVATDGNFVGVVAKTEWAAIQAAEKLQVTWSPPQFKLPGNPDELYAFLKNTKSFTTLKGAEKGNAAAALGKAKKQYEAAYRWPFQMHGMIGPSCAVADVRDDKATVWWAAKDRFARVPRSRRCSKFLRAMYG